MASEKVNQATSDKLKEMNWMKNIEICELVARDPGQAKDVIKAIKKRLNSKHANPQLFAVMLLEMLMNNCGEHIHKQVIENGLLPILVKIVKKKTNWPVRERIFLLLDAMQTALGGASGKYPQYYSAYYDLVSSGVKFPPRPHVTPTEVPVQKAQATSLTAQESQSKKGQNVEKQETAVPDSSIIQKASSTLEILRDVLNALDPKHPEGAADEFVLDLVEQCSFQKQRIMHLVMTSRDEKVVTHAIGLNEQLHQVLTRHDALFSIHPTTTTSLSVKQEEEEEDAEHLFRRFRKGKARAEDDSEDSVASFRSASEERMRRPLIRPLSIHPSDPDSKPRPLSIQSTDTNDRRPVISLPPPPSKYTEREKFFKDNNMNGSALASHVRGLSLHSSNGSSSLSGSTDCSEKDVFGFQD